MCWVMALAWQEEWKVVKNIPESSTDRQTSTADTRGFCEIGSQPNKRLFRFYQWTASVPDHKLYCGLSIIRLGTWSCACKVTAQHISLMRSMFYFRSPVSVQKEPRVNPLSCSINNHLLTSDGGMMKATCCTVLLTEINS